MTWPTVAPATDTVSCPQVKSRSKEGIQTVAIGSTLGAMELHELAAWICLSTRPGDMGSSRIRTPTAR
jgi:hypothetical protein